MTQLPTPTPHLTVLRTRKGVLVEKNHFWFFVLQILLGEEVIFEGTYPRQQDLPLVLKPFEALAKALGMPIIYPPMKKEPAPDLPEDVVAVDTSQLLEEPEPLEPA